VVVEVLAAVVEVVVADVDGEDEQPASTTAIPTASAPGKAQRPRCSPMATLSLRRFSSIQPVESGCHGTMPETRRMSSLFL
jgi:hypothetical protein